MQKISIVLFFFIYLNSSFAQEKLVVGTYDSFSADWGPGPIIEEKFEKIKDQLSDNLSLPVLNPVQDGVSKFVDKIQKTLL